MRRECEDFRGKSNSRTSVTKLGDMAHPCVRWTILTPPPPSPSKLLVSVPSLDTVRLPHIHSSFARSGGCFMNNVIISGTDTLAHLVGSACVQVEAAGFEVKNIDVLGMQYTISSQNMEVVPELG
ncbi:uncharacterized protein EDB91DRAFT_1086692 [Suillus paluster]|uniref:uncharacterized protein n=1 Tax=Suillus paluster TaxID=48578 RepID=UPI001B87BB1F|nr:uncharacterized protein EDB91DRAFT_1086692 [Suillus paluster]KAG1726717.1 hypothetical protein EDB91DRAFT_1086692 [Suillus paluster]